MAIVCGRLVLKGWILGGARSGRNPGVSAADRPRGTGMLPKRESLYKDASDETVIVAAAALRFGFGRSQLGAMLLSRVASKSRAVRRKELRDEVVEGDKDRGRLRRREVGEVGGDRFGRVVDKFMSRIIEAS